MPGWRQEHYQLASAAIAAPTLALALAVPSWLAAPPGSRIARHLAVWLAFATCLVASAPCLAVSDALLTALPVTTALAATTALLLGRPRAT